MVSTQPPLPHEAYLAAIAALDEVGPARMRWLLGLGGPSEVWARIGRGALPVPPARLAVDAEVLGKWRSTWREHTPATLWRRCEQLDVGVVALGSPAYPSALADDPEPPVVLFHRGTPEALTPTPRVAVVGTRRATGYGLRVAAGLGRDLASAGIVVVSGLALGIDAAAHRGAVAVDGADPLAVVAAGLDAPCPVRNRDLARQVADRGAVLSEVPPGVPGARWRYPVRNRILAALADAVVVVESSGGGGSMHTVRAALERDCPVMAVPGPVDSPASEGTNELLVDGAAPVRDAQDVLVALGHPGAAARSGAGGERSGATAEQRRRPSGDAATLLDLVSWRAVSVEELARRSGLGFGALSAALVHLETDGWILQRDGWVERLARTHSA